MPLTSASNSTTSMMCASHLNSTFIFPERFELCIFDCMVTAPLGFRMKLQEKKKMDPLLTLQRKIFKDKSKIEIQKIFLKVI